MEGRSGGCQSWKYVLLYSGILTLSFLTHDAVAAPPPPDARTDCAMVIKILGRGINLAGALEAPREGQWRVTLRDDYFAVIEQAGFTTVRVPIRWSSHASWTAPYTVDPAFWERIGWVIAESKTHHLNAILD
jgi:endoglucanase